MAAAKEEEEEEEVGISPTTKTNMRHQRQACGITQPHPTTGTRAHLGEKRRNSELKTTWERLSFGFWGKCQTCKSLLLWAAAKVGLVMPRAEQQPEGESAKP